MNRFLINYAWDIMDLGKANGVDNGVAREMFVENLNTYGTDAYPGYGGADIDYEAVSRQWQAMSPEDQAAAKTACRDFMTDCYEEISETRRVGSLAKFLDIAAEYEIPEEAPAEEHLLRGHAWDIWDKADMEGLTLAEARDAYVETLEGWGALTDAEKQAENEWFGWAVAPYDKGLQYARMTDNRALFESLLARL